MNPDIFYLTAWHQNAPEGGVYTFELEPSGRPVQRGFAPLRLAGYLAFSPNRRFLYSTGADAAGTEGAAAFEILPDGTLKALNFVVSGGKSTCHCCVSPDGRFLYTANYFSSSVSEFRVDPESGRILELSNLTFHSGNGPVPKRQECAHPHFSCFTPEGRYVAVNDLGTDRIHAYAWTPAEGLSIAGAKVTPVNPPGSGPRHLVFNRRGTLAYLINELGNTVQSYRYDDGKFEFIASVDLLPRGVALPSKAAAIRLDPAENFLMATNRGYDSVVSIKLDGQGEMEVVSVTLSGGKSPRDANFLPGGKFFAAANEFSDDVFFFDYDGTSGRLTPNGYQLQLPRPLCILF